MRSLPSQRDLFGISGNCSASWRKILAPCHRLSSTVRLSIISPLLNTYEMKTCKEIRHENLLKLIDQIGSTQKLADRLGKTHSQISQLKNKSPNSRTGKARGIGDDAAREIEITLGLETGWMDHEHSLGKPTPFTFSFSKPLNNTTIKVIELMEAMDDETRGAVYGATLMLIKALPRELQERILKVG